MEWVKLGDVAEISSGGTPRRSNVDYWKNGDIPWIKISDMKSKYVSETEEFITESGLKNSSAKLFKQGTIIYTIFATIGEIAILDIDATTNQAIAGITLIDNRINKEYIYYYLLSMKEQMKGIARGVAQKNLNLSILKDVSIPLLDIQKQKELVSYFKINESLISTRKAQITALDELVQSVFYEMFGDIRINEKKFELKYWKEVLKINNGKSQKKVENVDGDYPIYGSGGVMSYADDWLTKENSVIIGRKGNINTPLLVKEKFWHVDTAFGLEPKEDILNVHYLYGFCQEFNFETLNKAVTIPSLTKKDLLEIQIPLPPIELQEQFAAKVEAIEAQKAKLQTSLEEMETLFDALMQEAFSGNLG